MLCSRLSVLYIYIYMRFPSGSDSKESASNAGDTDRGSIPGRKDPLEEGMATHSNSLSWRIPRTEEPVYGLSLIFSCMCIYVCVCVYIYIYIYTHTHTQNLFYFNLSPTSPFLFVIVSLFSTSVSLFLFCK